MSNSTLTEPQQHNGHGDGTIQSRLFQEAKKYNTAPQTPEARGKLIVIKSTPYII